MPEECRICLKSITRNCANLNDYREGLALSTIVMILLPIKILDSDGLPQKICLSCEKILTESYRLREISLKSDQHLREQTQEQRPSIKCEFIQEPDFFGVYEEEPESIPSPHFETVAIVKPPPSREILDFEEIYTDDLVIEFNNKKSRVKNASKVWSYFGKLVNENFEEVGSGDYHYCSLCLKNKKIVKYRKTSATTSLMSHLESIHGVTKDGEVIEELKNDDFKQPKKRKFEGGAATICYECGKGFSCSTILKRHMRIHGEKTFACSR